jgi:hypothetical protein
VKCTCIALRCCRKCKVSVKEFHCFQQNCSPLPLRRKVVKEILNFNSFSCYKFSLIPPRRKVFLARKFTLMQLIRPDSCENTILRVNYCISCVQTRWQKLFLYNCSLVKQRSLLGETFWQRCWWALWSVLPSAPFLYTVMSVLEDREWLDRLNWLNEEFLFRKGGF